MGDATVPCRALRILCAAADQDRLMQLKRASVAAEWELVGGARSLDELEGQIRTWSPQVIVLDALLGPEAIRLAHRLMPASQVVIVGDAPGVPTDVAWLEDVRSAILGTSGRSGPPSQ